MAEKQALKGVKVVIIGGVVTAPTMGRYLALHGATVVRVDGHTRMDSMRYQRPIPPEMVGDPNGGVWWASINSSALCIGLDLTKPTGKAIVNRLVRWTDVVVENFSAGTLAKWGVDYHTVARERPEVIYLSSCLFGQTGPWSRVSGYGTAGAAMAGYDFITGWPDQEPTPLLTQYTDYINPKFGVATILAALEYRDRTGRGQYLDQAQVEGGLQLIAPVHMDWLNNGHTMERSGNRVTWAAPHGTFPCQGDDRWCAIAVTNDQQWQGFCRALEECAWPREERFATLLGRKRHEEELEELLGQWTGERSAEEAEAGLQREGVPASVVENTKDTYEDPQLRHRGFFRKIRHPFIGEHSYRGPSFILGRTPDSQSAGPALGEHSIQVCRMVGMTDDEITEALQEGGLGAVPANLAPAPESGSTAMDTSP